MTLNANFAGARMPENSGRLDGAARGLDALVGLVVLLAELIIVFVTTVIYLARLIIGRRSWTAPLWGLMLSSAVIALGWFIMSGGL